jgi:hypothetical protein
MLTAEDTTTLTELLADDRSKGFQGDHKVLLHDGEIHRYWPELDPDYYAKAVEFLELTESYTDPVVDGTTYAGVWRSAFVLNRFDRDDTPRIVQVLREGYASELWDAEARLVSDEEHKDLEELTHIRWVNLDPNTARVMREHLMDRDFTAASSDPTGGARGGVGSLVMRGDTYGAGFELAVAKLSWSMDDGSAVMDLILINTNSQELMFTIGLSCARTMTLYYAYNQPKGSLVSWMTGHGLNTNEAGKDKDYRVLRRNSELGTFDVMGSVTEFEKRTLEQHVAVASYGQTTWASGTSDDDEIAVITPEDGKIISVRARRNSRCLIDNDLSIVEPNDLPRTAGSATAKSSETVEEHNEDNDLDTAALEATAADINLRVEWFWRRTDAGNYAWILRQTQFEKLMINGTSLSAAFTSTTFGARRDPVEPAAPGAPPVGTTVDYSKECDELGGWNHRTVEVVAEVLDSGWMPVPTAKGVLNIRALRNVTIDVLQQILNDDVLPGEEVSMTPSFNNDGTVNTVIARRPSVFDVGIDWVKGVNITFNADRKEYEKYVVQSIMTSLPYKARRWIENAAVGGGNGGCPQPSDYALVGTWGAHHTGVDSLGGGVFKATCVWGWSSP